MIHEAAPAPILPSGDPKSAWERIGLGRDLFHQAHQVQPSRRRPFRRSPGNECCRLDHCHCGELVTTSAGVRIRLTFDRGTLLLERAAPADFGALDPGTMKSSALDALAPDRGATASGERKAATLRACSEPLPVVPAQLLDALGGPPG